MWSKGYRTVLTVDLPAFGCPVCLRWRKRRGTFPNPECGVRSFIEQDPGITAVLGLVVEVAGCSSFHPSLIRFTLR